MLVPLLNRVIVRVLSTVPVDWTSPYDSPPPWGLPMATTSVATASTGWTTPDPALVVS